jgi:Phytanoyl-CoA dioxygenase (PhyH)
MSQPANQVTSPEGIGPRALSHDDLEQSRRSFREHGYVAFRNVVSKERLSALRTRLIDEYERVRDTGNLFSGGGAISGHLNCFPGEESRFAYDAIQQHGIVDFIRSVTAKSIDPLHVGCNLNLPNSVPQHYHIDGPFATGFFVVNVAVVDTDLVNGAIDVLPGTHKRFYKYWRFALERKDRLTTRLPLWQGDVLVRLSTLWHRGMPNNSNAPRPMVAFTLGETNRPVVNADPFRINGGKIMFYPNWYRTNFLGRLRERTFVTAPFTYSAYRFVSSLFGDKGYSP